MPTMIPAKEETRDELKTIKKEFGVTYNDLLQAMLEEVNVENISLEQTKQNFASGGTHSQRRDEKVQQLIQKNERDKEIIGKSIDIVTEVYDAEELLESHAYTVAAGAVYTAGVLYNERQTQKALGHKYGCSEETVARQYKEMVEVLGV